MADVIKKVGVEIVKIMEDGRQPFMTSVRRSGCMY